MSQIKAGMILALLGSMGIDLAGSEVNLRKGPEELFGGSRGGGKNDFLARMPKDKSHPQNPGKRRK